MKDKLTCSECRKKDFKTAFEDWEGCSRGEGRRMALQAIFQGKRGHRN